MNLNLLQLMIFFYENGTYDELLDSTNSATYPVYNQDSSVVVKLHACRKVNSEGLTKYHYIDLIATCLCHSSRLAKFS